MKKRFCAFSALTILLCAALWLLCLRAPQTPPLGDSLQSGTVEDYERTIAYVPLDDRPDNLEPPQIWTFLTRIGPKSLSGE